MELRVESQKGNADSGAKKAPSLNEEKGLV
jgi:hypothetical protein